MSVRMSRDEAWDRIAAADVGIVTTLRRDGTPIATPMWFNVMDGAVHFGTPSKSKKAARASGTTPRSGSSSKEASVGPSSGPST